MHFTFTTLAIPLAPQDLHKHLASGKARAALERNVAHSSCAKGIPLAPEDLQINLASGKARAALERNVAHSSCATGIPL